MLLGRSVSCDETGKVILLDFGEFLSPSASNLQALYVYEANPRPVHDRVLHVDWHHIGSSPDGARPVHILLVYVIYFSRSKDQRALDVNRYLQSH
jgi:hypothetical protein